MTSRPARWKVCAGIALLLSVHAALLAYSATRHSPTLNEPGHLVAGVRIWKYRQYELYRVNPPLTKMVAALPVIAAGCEEDWSGLYESPGARPVFDVGSDFVAANGARSFWLFTLARWACIPISMLGGVFCFLWSKELWNCHAAGFLALTLWCFEPNVLAHAELITPDCAAAAFGVGAGWTFWRWLKQPTWLRAMVAGLLLGLAELSKMTWVVLFALWPLLWLLDVLRQRFTSPRSDSHRAAGMGQLAVIMLIALYVLNLAYAYDGTLMSLKDFTFVSNTLTGSEEHDQPGNRFADSWIGRVPVPFPKQYVLGMDVQKADFEAFSNPSYLWGEWKFGGWWYYYLCGLLFKVPLSLQLLFLLSLLAIVRMRSSGRSPDTTGSGLIVLVAPAAAVLILVSSQTAMNHHFRYVLPAFGFAFVLCGATARWAMTERA